MNRSKKRQRRPRTSILLLMLMAAGLLLAACGTPQPKTFTIGVVNFSPALGKVLDGFKDNLADLGYVEGENVTYFYDGPVGSIEAIEPAIQKLLAEEVDLIFAITTPATQKAKEAVAETGTPVVFAPVTDPVDSGLVPSLTRPGGNLTGIRSGGSIAKGLDWLQEMAPDMARLYVPHNPDDNSSVQGLAELQAAATKMELDLTVVEVRTSDEFAAALAAIPGDAGAIFMLPSGFFSAHTDLLVETAIAHNLPLGSVAPKAADGVLISYGHDYVRIGEQAARLADQILRGTSPADLPVETADFFLGINLQTAEAIGLHVSDDILGQADYIVR